MICLSYAKPKGVILVPAGTEEAMLAALPVRKLPGIGPVAEQKLHALGIVTLGDLVRAPDAALRPIFEQVQRHDADMASQLKRAGTSVTR